MAVAAKRGAVGIGEAELDFEDLVTALESPPNRVGKSDGAHEYHLYEAPVMVAYAIHLLRTADAHHVRIHPDGEHGKQFDFAGWLLPRAFAKVSSLGTTAYGGVYQNAVGQTVTVNPKSGLGDVVAEVGDRIISAECKGGIINTRHPGQVSRLYKGLRETVVPLMEGTLRLATRCALAGIEIALVGSRGEVMDVNPARDADSAPGAIGATDKGRESGKRIVL